MLSRKNIFFIVLILLLSGTCGFIFSWYQHRDINTSASDDVHVIQTFHYPATFVKQLANDPRAGEKIFREFCSACHSPSPLIDIRAPHIGDEAAWKALRQVGLEALLNITIHGVGAMPARGGCFECSDDQLRDTIKYMLSAPSRH